MTTRAEAIKAAGECIASGYRVLHGLDGHSVAEAARAAYTPTGPSIDELEARIRETRGLAPLAEKAKSA